MCLFSCFRDDEVLKDWRVKTKKIQQKKHYESMVKGTKGMTLIIPKSNS